MSKIIAICNQKGGVGKTTTTFNLGAALAMKEGKSVLLVDLDPQANLSEYLKFEEDNLPTITQLITQVSMRSAVSADTVRECIRFSDLGLEYIPSDINLANAETYMATAISRETVLKRILTAEVVNSYDYVLIDCLPSLGTLLINALTAADGMIIPVQTQKFSMDGLQALSSLSEQIRMSVNPALKITGILPTMAEHTNISRSALKTLETEYGDYLFQTVIHKSVEAAKSSETGTALCMTKNRLGEEYSQLAAEIVKKLHKG